MVPGGLSPDHPVNPDQPSRTPLDTLVLPLQILVLWSCEKSPPPSGKWPQTSVPLSIIQGRGKVRGAGVQLGRQDTDPGHGQGAGTPTP